ncbi:type IV pilus modification protein PilV [Shewanella sp. A25]|nr:type IV pilus modification protein PilV [Shewanella shenzhenensis]
MTKNERLTYTKYQQGISLIEVLVALVILVIGLIGIFNLHIVAKRGSFESFQQTQASYYATDIINRMKLNRTQLANYVGTYNYKAPPSMAKNCEAQVCSPGQMATWDKYDWGKALFGSLEVVGTENVGGLDSATACIGMNEIVSDGAKGNYVVVAIVWRGIRETTVKPYEVIDAEDGNISANKSVVTNCFADAAIDNRRLFVINTVII